jgi:hypothetical protein
MFRSEKAIGTSPLIKGDLEWWGMSGSWLHVFRCLTSSRPVQILTSSLPPPDLSHHHLVLGLWPLLPHQTPPLLTTDSFHDGQERICLKSEQVMGRPHWHHQGTPTSLALSAWILTKSTRVMRAHWLQRPLTYHASCMLTTHIPAGCALYLQHSLPSTMGCVHRESSVPSGDIRLERLFSTLLLCCFA